MKGGSITTALAIALPAALLPGCGTSIHAVYEGDIRFEHCMALDARLDVKSKIRQRCWIEWVAFYTFGQTRDRVTHAQLRVRQLSGDGKQQVSSAEPPLSAPIPTSGLDLGTSTDSSRVGKSDRDYVRCADDCETLQEDCTRDCSSATPRDNMCQKSCSASFSRCLEDCA